MALESPVIAKVLARCLGVEEVMSYNESIGVALVGVFELVATRRLVGSRQQ